MPLPAARPHLPRAASHPPCPLSSLPAPQVPIRVVYLDRSLAPGGGGGGDSADGATAAVHDFVPEGCPAPAVPRVHLLYRPGHYDLAYPLAQ